MKQDLLATVGLGTIIVRDAPETDLSGLNRNQEKSETIFTLRLPGTAKPGMSAYSANSRLLVRIPSARGALVL